MKPSTSKKAGAFKRDRPDLPVEFAAGDDAARWFADGEFAAIQEKHLQDVEATNLKIDTLRIDGSVLERVQLGGGEFGSAVWKDVRLVGCDLANIRAHRIALVRVELIDCRLTGFTTRALDWQDVLIQNGDVRYAQFQGGRFRSCEFEGCNWEDADLQNSDLRGSVLRSCKLARTDLRGAKLENTDLRTSEVEGVMVGMNDLRGAIVDPAQAMVFAQILGLQIR
ncbi:MAG: pentapeptide repeat-containing protein [Candidatus Solibacter sp.]|nr:pentapeptide repeat-containing protein [Candidatus Solibacter sp.]